MGLERESGVAKKMSTESCSNDNVDPKVDNNSVVATADTDILAANSVGDEDIFVCGKCNKVFKDLSEYLEHKVRDENYRISHARSKVNKRLVIPHLVRRKKKNTSQTGSQKDATESIVDEKCKENSSLPNEGETESQNKTHVGGDHIEAQTPSTDSGNVRKRGKKRKLDVLNEKESESLEKENVCHICSRRFRRAATLRWHLKYDHKSKEDDADVSDNSDYGISKDDTSNNDEDFRIKEERREKDHTLDEDKNSPFNTEANFVTAKGKKLSIRTEDSKSVDQDERPYVCEICGRGFKELPVYKAHGMVHSQERNFICTVQGCPYGFKTKGCLVRHMRRHTGERPFECDKCGRSFTESGALSRHLKARSNCALTPDSHYPRYKKRWSYHPNIEAVIDAGQRESHSLAQPLETKYIFTSDSLALSETVDSNSLVKENKKQENTDLTKESETFDAERDNESELTVDVAVDPSPISSSSFTLKSQTTVDDAEDELAELKRNSDRTGLKDTQCHVCKKDYQYADHLEMHLHSHLAYQPTQCGFCHFLATNRDEMHEHVLSLHAESLSDTESFVFAMQGDDSKKGPANQGEKATLREALLAVKQLYSLKASKTSSESGAINPSTAGSLQCLVCSKTFKGVNYMRQHMRMHTGDRPFKCDHCDSSFTSRDVLKKHMYVHIDQRDFKCGECGKLFKRLSHVQQHLRIHSQDRAFRCSVCEKLFKTHNTLKVHLRTHTNINPYKCQVCNRHFRERGSLQRHMRLHTGERPFACPHCNRRFAEQGTLSRHLKAKVPCSVNRDANLQPASANPTMLAQFSSVVADTQEYILPAVQEEELSGNFVVLKSAENESDQVVENVEIFTEESLPENKEATFQYVSEIGGEEVLEQVSDDNTETLQIYDANTGESLFITGDKSVMEMVKSQQVALETTEGGIGLEKIREMLLAADSQMPVENANEGSHPVVIEDEMMLVKSEEVIKEIKKEDTQQADEKEFQTAPGNPVADVVKE